MPVTLPVGETLRTALQELERVRAPLLRATLLPATFVAFWQGTFWLLVAAA